MQTDCGRGEDTGEVKRASNPRGSLVVPVVRPDHSPLERPS